MEIMNPLGWDDVDSGALAIERVDPVCEPRPGLMIGLTDKVMNPLGWAFTAPLILDPSVEWLLVSPEREGSGWDFVRWLMKRTGSGRRHFDGKPVELPR
jgi:hypothetical protein